MLKSIVIALITFGLVVFSSFTLTPAKATTPNLDTYFWSYAYPGTSQVVCKKVAMLPDNQVLSRSSQEKSVKMYTRSTIVSDSYCANLTKPYSGNA